MSASRLNKRQVLNAYLGLSELPEWIPARKGDLLIATTKLIYDPIFGSSELVVLGYNPRKNRIAATSLVEYHSAYMFSGGVWIPTRLKREIEELGFWKVKQSEQGADDYMEDHLEIPRDSISKLRRTMNYRLH